MLSRKASSNDLGLIIGVTFTCLALLVLCGLLFIWYWRTQSSRNTSRSNPAHRLALPLHKTRSEMPSAPNSASSYASTFTFPNKNQGTLTDLKDPFRFPTSLPTPPPQAAVFTAYRACAAPPPHMMDVDSSMLKSPSAYSTLDKSHSSDDHKLHPYRSNTGDDNDSERWETSYYENKLPASRPPSYYRTPSRGSRNRSHSPVPVPLRSTSLKALSRRPSSTILTRPISQPLDITISTDVHVHIDSLYVEAHTDNDEEKLDITAEEQRVRIMSVAPQIPSIYLPSMYLGVPFESFGTLEGGKDLGAEKLEVVEAEKRREPAEGMREFVFPKRAATLAGPVAPASRETANVRPLQRAISANKDGRTIPAGWF